MRKSNSKVSKDSVFEPSVPLVEMVPKHGANIWLRSRRIF